MAVPKKKKSRTRRDKRRAQHKKLVKPQLVDCPNCGEAAMPHHVCKSCGYYKNEQILEVEQAKKEEEKTG